ncbi:MAG: hypothetical protein EOO41_01820 [Methanobacteriota archaeon]|nr:MAG: hypothetical protein EOO41_01820 [Euryarchaeota archaeon]
MGEQELTGSGFERNARVGLVQLWLESVCSQQRQHAAGGAAPQSQYPLPTTRRSEDDAPEPAVAGDNDKASAMSAVVRMCTRIAKALAPDLVQAAKDEVIDLVSRDSFQRFKRTEVFRDWKRSLRIHARVASGSM